jgi:hypothetical protein
MKRSNSRANGRRPVIDNVPEHELLQPLHAAGGGWPAICGRLLSKHAQSGALAVHIVNAGLAKLGSSNVPTRTNIRCGLVSASLKSGVPHARQNRRRMRFPLLDTLK